MKNSKQFYIDWLKETAAKFKSGEIGPEYCAYTHLDDDYFLILSGMINSMEPYFSGELSLDEAMAQAERELELYLTE